MSKDIRKVQRDQLRNPKYLEVYLRDHYRKGPEEFRFALREAVLSQDGGFAALSRRTGLARAGLYKALSAHGNPSYRTVYQVLDALGMRTVVAKKEIPVRRQKSMEQTKTYVEIADEEHGKGAKGPAVQEAQKAQMPRILPGSAKGLFVMADDFDAPLPEFSEYM